MHQLEGLQHVTTLDFNMGYYTLRLYTASQDMETIVTEFGKFRYNRLSILKTKEKLYTTTAVVA